MFVPLGAANFACTTWSVRLCVGSAGKHRFLRDTRSGLRGSFGLDDFWSPGAGVADGGTTVMLLGAALSALGIARCYLPGLSQELCQASETASSGEYFCCRNLHFDGSPKKLKQDPKPFFRREQASNHDLQSSKRGLQ